MRLASRAVLVAAIALISVPDLPAAPACPPVALSLPRFQRASRLCHSAEKAMRIGNIRKAQESLSRALEVWPDFSAAHMGMGHIALGERRFADALREYRLARDLYADMTAALLQLRAQDFTDAKSEVVMLRDSMRAQERLAPSPVRVTRLEAAISRLEALGSPGQRAEEEPPGEIDFYIGNALFHLDRVGEAVQAWQECVRKNRRFPFVYQNLAVGFWKMGNLPEARRTLETAESLSLPVSSPLKADIEKSLAGTSSAPAH